MKEGVILAGGNGTRLGHNRPYNKHLAMVYDRPMIEYPAQNLLDMGITKAQIVSSPDATQAYREATKKYHGEFACV